MYWVAAVIGAIAPLLISGRDIFGAIGSGRWEEGIGLWLLECMFTEPLALVGVGLLVHT
jgi:hypothetical protein